jgi:unsaturated rhamnogalacturonyl hydrolase
MKRRSFLKSSVASASAFSLAGIGVSCFPRKNNTESPLSLNQLNKVMIALLTIQRASWEHGVAMQAFLENGNEDLVILMAKEAVLRQNAEGQLSVVYQDNGVTDPAASGESVMFAYRKTGNIIYKEAYEKMLGYLLTRAPNTDGIIHHVKNSPEVWIDAMYMAPPFLSLAGRPDEAIKQIMGWKQCLWNEQEHLFYHIYNIRTKRFVRQEFWGVGNGWAAAGIGRVISGLPEEMKNERDELITLNTSLIQSCLRYMRPEGLFHDVINKPETFIETNLSQMLAYTIYRGVSEKWLDEGLIQSANGMRDAANKKIDADGFVQGVCGSPNFNSPGTAAEGQAFNILMEAAYRKYMQKL